MALPGCDWLPPGVQAAMVDELINAIGDDQRAYVCEALECAAFEVDLDIGKWAGPSTPTSGSRQPGIYDPSPSRPAGGG
jgi:hypothetical protein